MPDLFSYRLLFGFIKRYFAVPRCVRLMCCIGGLLSQEGGGELRRLAYSWGKLTHLYATDKLFVRKSFVFVDFWNDC